MAPSSRITQLLVGYPKVRVYEGSWTEYSQSDLPVETGAERPA